MLPSMTQILYSHVCVQGTPENAIRKWKRDFKNALHLYLVYFQNALSKPSFRVPSNLIFSAILFNIVKLVFPHKFQVCNAICVAHRVAYRVVVSYIWRVHNAPREIITRFANLENAMKRYPTHRHDYLISWGMCIIKQDLIITIFCHWSHLMTDNTQKLPIINLCHVRWLTRS